MLKKFFGLLAIIFALNFSTAIAAQISPVTDQAGLLSASEIDSLNQKIHRVEQTHKIKIGVVFVESIGELDMVTASNNLLDEYFANGMNGGIVLLVAMDKRKYEMSTDRRMVNIITDSNGIPLLKESFQSELSAGNYYGAANNFVDGVEELVSYYETNGGAYGTLAPEGFDPVAATGAVIISLFLGVMIRSSLIGKMSNIHHAAAAIDYLKKNTVKLKEKRDTFLFMNVQRRPKGGGNRRGGSSHGGGGGSF